jgi:hypothetical protein
MKRSREAPPHMLESTRTLLDWEEAWQWHRCEAEATDDAASVAFCENELALIRRELGRREKLRDRPGAPAWPQASKMALSARFQYVKDAVPIDTFLSGSQGLMRRRQNRDGSIVGCCPLPDHRDVTPSFRITGQRWHCFGCNRGGDVFDIVMALEGFTQPYEALVWLEKGLGIVPDPVQNGREPGNQGRFPSNDAGKWFPTPSGINREPRNHIVKSKRTRVRYVGGQVTVDG